MTRMLEAMLNHHATAQCLGHCKLSNPRTYARTHKEPLTFWSYITLGDAHRGGKRFRRLGDENSRTASAARGLDTPAVSHA